MASVHEKEINFGRSWDYPPLGENEVIISSSLADAMDINIGDIIQVDVNISQWIATVPDSSLEQYPEIECDDCRLFKGENATMVDDEMRSLIIASLRQNATIERDFTVVNTIGSPEGKWPSSYGSVIVLSLRMMREMLKEELNTVLFFSELDFVTLEEIDPFQAIDDLAMQYLVLSEKHASIYTGGSMAQYRY
ncbi:hypothetical protein JH06_1263 [Blastocystis sp. subtype 4]|uniref:hypothetical protein n=1 Tax=Blastocystis sp. subtype 4 TaxID=944170 RepID=UPI0007115C31|nr:hypothetical protein JH06_1263 [Blastocystis sp. subtype 4]KNB45141.1 hypothetical protein JH06_1263 [Blastocystis sp. subtype 4]|eukprot:XP_014528584.1 hypothetical protein JH06_1263 [Blastocystis sp. subtype 4]